MAMQPHAPHRSKTLAEGAVCFTCVLGLLAVASVALQFMMGFVP